MKIATFNLYQFVQHHHYWYTRHKKNKYKAEQWKQKKQWALDQLDRMNADIVGFQEVFSVDELKELTQSIGYSQLINVDNPTMHPDDKRVFTHPICALASRFPVLESSGLRIDSKHLKTLKINEGFRFSRMPLRAVIDTPDLGEVIVYVVHLKSKRPVMDEVIYPKKMPWAERTADTFKRRSLGHIASLIQRGAEATLIYQAVVDDLTQYPNKPLILMGDLNDDFASISSLALSMSDYLDNPDDLADFVSKQAQHNKTFTLTKQVKKNIQQIRLYDSFDLSPYTQDKVRPFTSLYQGKANYLDYILVSNHLNLKNPQALGYISHYETLNEHLLQTTRVSKELSDHAQVVVTIQAGANPQQPIQFYDEKLITRQSFVNMAGGVYQSSHRYAHLSNEDKWNHFWSFFFDTQRGWVRSVYGAVSVESLFQKQRHSIEHVIPESFLNDYLKRQHVPRQVRYGATVNPFNWVPSDKKINSSRSNFPFEMSADGEILRPHRMRLDNDVYVTIGLSEDHLWVVPPRAKGDIARAILYMVLMYEIDELYNSHVESLIHWARTDPPSSWEFAYNQWVYERLGIRNPFIDSQDKVERLFACENLMGSAVFKHS